MTTRPSSHDEYLAALPDDQRAALQELRSLIRAAAPRAEECISYALPAFRQDGALVGYGAGASHCALYPMNGSTVAAYRDELAGFETSKGAIRFTPDRPLPPDLVRTLVHARIAENASRKQQRGGGS
jgi:uncharacterized protein YdhG (YjbR/CyaY superfamily)